MKKLIKAKARSKEKNFYKTIPSKASVELKEALDYVENGGKYVELEEVTITENEIVTPDEGKAFSKVTVNVPAPTVSYADVIQARTDLVGFAESSQLAGSGYTAKSNFTLQFIQNRFAQMSGTSETYYALYSNYGSPTSISEGDLQTIKLTKNTNYNEVLCSYTKSEVNYKYNEVDFAGSEEYGYITKQG